MNDDLLELRMWRDGNIMHENCLEDMKKLKAERDEARRNDSTPITERFLFLLRKTEELRRERDEARRMYCEKVSNACRQYGTSANDVAKEKGWDCYKSDTLSQEVSQEGCKEKQ